MTALERISDAAPAEKLLYYVLAHSDGWVTQQDLAAETQLAQRTVRHAIAKLVDSGVVESRTCLQDARMTEYREVPTD